MVEQEAPAVDFSSPFTVKFQVTTSEDFDATGNGGSVFSWKIPSEESNDLIFELKYRNDKWQGINPSSLPTYYSVQENMFFEGISTYEIV